MQEMQDDIVRILYKLVNDISLEPEEQQALDHWLNKSPHNNTVREEIMDDHAFDKEIRHLVAEDRNHLWNKIKKGLEELKKASLNLV
jgi:hypothetical protein